MKVERALARQLDDNVTELQNAWGPLKRRAYYLSPQRMDADDVMASAVASTWEKWVEGTGPATNITAYITQSMRNGVIDEMRSPRAAEISLDNLLLEPTYVDDYSRVDLHIENGQLAAAMQRLPEMYRRLLIDLIVHDRKPRDLEDEYGMSAPAISTASYRAKKALRAALFLEMMRGFCSLTECAAAQAHVSQQVARASGIDDYSAKTAALWRCCACAAGLRRYLAMTDRRVA